MATNGQRISLPSLALYTSLCAALFFLIHQLRFNMASEGGQLHLHNGLVLRAATSDDLDSLTRIVQVGFPDDPEVNYRFPKREQYPEDYYEWTRKEYQGYLGQPKTYVVHLIEIADESDGKVVMKPAALAVWDIAVLTQANGSGTSKSLDVAAISFC